MRVENGRNTCFECGRTVEWLVVFAEFMDGPNTGAYNQEGVCFLCADCLKRGTALLDGSKDVEEGVVAQTSRSLLNLIGITTAAAALAVDEAPLSQLAFLTLEEFAGVVDNLTTLVKGVHDDRESRLNFWRTCVSGLTDAALMAIAGGIPHPERWAAEAMRLFALKKELAMMPYTGTR